jgi:hypothetical protein
VPVLKRTSPRGVRWNRNILDSTGIEVDALSFGTLILGKVQDNLPVREGSREFFRGFAACHGEVFSSRCILSSGKKPF